MTTDITELAPAMKAAAMKATPGQWVAFTHTDSRTFSVHTPDDKRCGDVIKWAGFDGQRKAKANAEFIALANPANVRALVEALEKAQAKNALVAGGIEASTKLHERIGSLTSENAALKGSVENAAGCINAAYAEGLIDVLAESSDERLVDLVKRRLLHAYLPVETPATDDVLVAMGDAVLLEQLECGGKAIISQSNIIGLQANRIAELESCTVTVKLPKPISALHRREFTEAHCAIYAYPEAEVNAALDDSGIKWEAE